MAKRVIKKVEMFVEECPDCKKEIRGSTESEVDWNMKVHKEWHKKQESKKDDS